MVSHGSTLLDDLHEAETVLEHGLGERAQAHGRDHGIDVRIEGETDRLEYERLEEVHLSAVRRHLEHVSHRAHESQERVYFDRLVEQLATLAYQEFSVELEDRERKR